MECQDAAHAVRSYRPAPATAGDAPNEIWTVLRTCGLRDLGLRAAAFTTAAGAEARILVRLDTDQGVRKWSLAPLDASVLAIILRADDRLRAGERIAAALCRGVQDAEDRLADLHRRQHAAVAGGVC
jgi:hypothetical protein